jgi:hypothetical protein
MVEPAPARTRRAQDLERATREVARVADPVAAGLLRGLIEMQADLIQRLAALEAEAARGARSAARRQGPASKARP